ncbi:hypothetical protein, partial [Phenylobacterium sp.]|uniref:hypothetical protein n=1 Tax=Phenylobacterium sp. TaxID=1871053 RepID=UPI0025D97CDF
CLQETADFVSVQIGHKAYRQNAAACVSLSFSTMSKTVTGSRPPHCLAPVAGGGGYLVADLGGVNRPFQAFFTPPP